MTSFEAFNKKEIIIKEEENKKKEVACLEAQTWDLVSRMLILNHKATTSTLMN